MSPHRGRVAVDVTPRLFSDALSTLLTKAGVEVVLEGRAEDISVLVTSGQPDQDDPITIVIHLPDTNELPRARLTNGQWVPLEGIAEVIRFVQEFAHDD